MSATFATGYKDDIPLACVRVAFLEKEDLVDAVISQRRYLHNNSQGSNQALLNDKVFLPANLSNISRGLLLVQQPAFVSSTGQVCSLRRGEHQASWSRLD